MRERQRISGARRGASRFILGLLCAIALACSSSEPRGVGGGSAVDAPRDDGAISAAQSQAGASYTFVDGGNVHVATNASQRLNITMRDGGARVERTDRPADWVELRWTGYGRGTDISEPPAPGAATAAENRVTFRHGAEEAWYLNGPLGLEHGYHLPNPPSVASTAPLTIQLEVSGPLVPVHRRAQIELQDATGSVVFHYSHLIAHDADGSALRTWMAVEDDAIVFARR